MLFPLLLVNISVASVNAIQFQACGQQLSMIKMLIQDFSLRDLFSAGVELIKVNCILALRNIV